MWPEPLRRRPQGDPPAVSLSARLKELQLPQGRLKTGTPPRIDGRSIDFILLHRAARRRHARAASAKSRVPVFSFLAPPRCTRGRCRAGSRTPMRARTTSSAAALTAAPCSPARSKGGAALLPQRGRQDQPLCRQGQPPDFSGARRPDHPRVLPQRHLHQPAV